MKFVLEMKMDGAAFHEGQEPYDRNRAHGYEAADLLRKIADRIFESDLTGPMANGALPGDYGVIIDSWGNSVGTWKVTK